MPRSLLIFCFCFCFLSCFAQNEKVNVQFFSVDDGLTGREIFSVQQDNRGLIWVATDNGLNSFDGQNFTIVEDSTFLLSSGEITGIRKTAHGKFWINKENTTPILFNPGTKKNESYLDLDSLMNRLEIIHFYGNSSLINFRDDLGQFYYLDEDQKILPYSKIGEPSSERQRPTPWNTTLVHYPDSNRVEEFDIAGNIRRVLYYPGENFFFYDSVGNYLNFVLEALDKTIELREYLFSLEEEGSFSPIVLKKNNKDLTLEDLITDEGGNTHIRMTKDSQGNIWLIINDHVFWFDKEGNFKEDLTEKLSSLGENIHWNSNHLFIDEEDRLWISSGIGIFLIQLNKNQFDEYLVDNKKYSTRGITELPDNKLLIFTYHGPHILDKTTKEIEWTNTKYGLGLTKVGEDTIYWGLEGKGFYQMVDKALTLHLDPNDPIYKNHAIQLPFWDEKSQQLFLGTNNGLFQWVNDSIQKYEKLNEFKELAQYQITNFYQNEEGIWIGSSNGIYFLDRTQGIIKHISLPHHDVRHIHEDSEGDFWIGTGGGGLIYWERSKNEFRQLTTKNGLAHNFIYAVYEDNLGYLWLPSNNGLMRFDKKSEEIVTFNVSDGLPHQEFNTYSHYQSNDGRLYFGGINGVIAFYPDQLNFKENNAPFIVTALQQYDARKGKLIDKSNQFSINPKIELKSGDRFFTLDFSLLDYGSEQHSFAWRISGLEKEWNYQRENSLRINSLPYGNYTLEIKAKGEGGNWAKNELIIPISVRRPIYHSPFFWLAFGIGLISLLYLGHWFRLRNLKKKQIYLENEIAERTNEITKKNEQLIRLNSDKDQFFSIIGHDLRGPLLSLRGISKKVSFLIQQNRMEEVHQLGESIEQSTTRVTKLLDNLLNWALVQKGRFPYHPSSHNVHAVVQEMCDIYQTTADLKNISLENLTIADHLAFLDRNALSTVVRNLIDNAMKFTDAFGKIEIKSISREDEILLKILDSGTGISPEILENIFEFNADRKKMIKGTGLGLVLCKDLIEMNKGSIEVESEIGKGTTFTIKVPKSQVEVQKEVIFQ